MRLWVLVILLSLLPRLAMASPGANLVCISDTHIAYDCHTPDSRSDCSDEPADDALGLSEADCLDLPVAGPDIQPERPTTVHVPLSVLFLAVVSFDVLPEAKTPLVAPDGLTDSPPFCARSHSCFITIRC